MEFKHITSDKCKHCSNTIIASEDIELERNWHDRVSVNIGYRYHVNGQRWESRKFSCGCGVRWIPNFRREEWYGECCNTKEYEDKMIAIQKTEKEIKALRDKIDKLKQKDVAY